jgi:hypothetical protein
MIQQLKKFFFAAMAVATVSNAAQAQSFEAGAQIGFSTGYSISAFLNSTFKIIPNLTAIANLSATFADLNGIVSDNPRINFETGLTYEDNLGNAGPVYFSGRGGGYIVAAAESNASRSFDFSAAFEPRFNINAYYAINDNASINTGFGGAIHFNLLTASGFNPAIGYSYVYQYNQLNYVVPQVKGLTITPSVSFSLGFDGNFNPGTVGASVGLAATYQLTPSFALRLESGYPISFSGSTGPFSISLRGTYKF